MMSLINLIKYKQKINKLENRIEELESVIKEELFKNLIDNTTVALERDRLKKENKMLIEKNKTLKSIVKEKD